MMIIALRRKTKNEKTDFIYIELLIFTAKLRLLLVLFPVNRLTQ
jgi:hypothetical protein